MILGSNVNEGGKSEEERRAIEYASNFQKSARVSGIFDFETIRWKIDSQKPFIMDVHWITENGGIVGWFDDTFNYKGHAVVIAGYRLDSKQVQIVDPWQNTLTDFFPYSGLLTGQNLYTGYGKYRASIHY